MIRSAGFRWVVAAATAATALACVPEARVPVVLAADVAGTVAPWIGMARFRPARRAPWVLTSAMFGFWTLGMSASGGQHRLAAAVLVVAGQLIAFVLVVVCLTGRRGDADADDAANRTASAPGRALGRRTDAVLLLAVVGLVVAQVVRAAIATPRGHLSWLDVVPVSDVLIVGLMLRFALSRAVRQTSSLLNVTAGVGAVVYDILQTRSGHRVVPLGDPIDVLWTAVACLFALGALHPTMALAFDPTTLRSRRTESARLVGMAPLAVVPAALYAIGGSGHLPTSVYLMTSGLFAALGLLRGAQAVRTSEWRAEHDPLTALANRRGLERAFKALRSRPVTTGGVLCLLDLDDFKDVNDSGGHHAGDALLRQVADRLAGAVGDLGRVARSGGDEFVVLMASASGSPDRVECEPGDLDQVRAVIEATFGAPFVVAGRDRHVTASVGVTVVGRASVLSHALADADIALYAAKGAGKNVTTGYRPQLREDVMRRLAMVEDLRTVLEGGSGAGALEVHYQPLVTLPGDVLVGFEALVRWRHGDRGLIAPDDFLPLAEEHGLATSLDRWVMVESLRQLARWDAAGVPPLRVSVNLGRSSMLADDLEDAVRTALAVTGLPPARLRVEITEHDALPATAGVGALRALAEWGVGVSLDDFGVGYTALDYLRRYPVDQLKLDRSITAPLEFEETSPLLEGIVALAHRLGVLVLAEGIETGLQRERLAGAGIDFAQGYHIARPMPALEAAQFVAARADRGSAVPVS